MAATRAGGTQEQGDDLIAAAATPKRVVKGYGVVTQNGKKRKSAFALVILLRFFFGYVKRVAVVGVGRRGAAQRGFKQA